MFGRTIDHWIGVLRGSLRTWDFHRATNTAHIVPYESLLGDPRQAVAAIADYLRISVTSQGMERILQRVSFEHVKDFSRHIQDLPPSRLARSGESLYDRETLLHRGHIRDGRIGYGAALLEQNQLEAIDAMLDKEGFAFLRTARRPEPGNTWNPLPSTLCP